PDGAHDSPTLTAMLNQNASLAAAGSNQIGPLYNQYVVPDSFSVVLLGPNAIASLGNKRPSITSANTASVPAGTTAVLTVTSLDPDDDRVIYSIIGGANASLFSIDPTTGALTFKTAPTYDGNTPANNTYVVEIKADDNKGGVDSQTITITVTPSSS